MKENHPVLTCRGLSKSFGPKKVLAGLDFEAAPGEVIGILGRNGSGKSTLFKILLDLTAPDWGSVSALGLSPDGSGKLRGLIGYVPEKPAFHGFMTVAETLAFRASFFGGWDKAKAEELCRTLELDTRGKRAQPRVWRAFLFGGGEKPQAKNPRRAPGPPPRAKPARRGGAGLLARGVEL